MPPNRIHAGMDTWLIARGNRKLNSAGMFSLFVHPLRRNARAFFFFAFNNMRSKAAARGFMSEEEIEAEIQAARDED